MQKKLTKNKKTPTVNRKNEVNRILKDNIDRGTMNKEDVYFARKFLNILLEELPSITDNSSLNPDQFTSELNTKDFENSLEPETPKDAFDIEGAEVNGGDAESFSSVYVKKCAEWVKKMKEFSSWLISIDKQDSLTTQLNDADRDGSVFKGITRKIGDNISKTAGELNRIATQLEKAVAYAPKKQRELQKLTKITECSLK